MKLIIIIIIIIIIVYTWCSTLQDHVTASVNSLQCSIQFKQVQCSEIPKECTVFKGRQPARQLRVLIVLSHFLAVTGNRTRSLIKAILLVVIKKLFFC